MNLHLLIAVPDEEQRQLLGIIYAASPLVASLENVFSCKDLHAKLEQASPDFVVVHQSLVTDISLLPRGHFVVLAEKMKKDTLIAVTDHGGYYFLNNPLPVAMLLAALNPTGATWVLEHLSRTGSSNMTNVLTAHEQTLLALWNEGFTDSEIAGKLVLSNGTVKKELETIRKKLRKHNISGIMRKGRGKKETDV